MDRDYRDYEEDWEETWKEIVTNPDGALNLDQVKRELSDYSMVMDIASEVYDDITHGQISKVNTTAETIINVANERQDDFYLELYSDDIKLILKENMSDADKLYEIKKYFEIE